jgi:hypothetical protein
MRSPQADPLPQPLAIARALRPLHRRVPSRTALEVDDQATAQLAAESHLYLPVRRPESGRWLDLALVVDTSASMTIWAPQVGAFRRLVERLGAFRDVRCYHFDADDVNPGGAGSLRLWSGSGVGTAASAPGGVRAGAVHDPRELVDPVGRRAILVFSDCVGAAWGCGVVAGALAQWGQAGPVAVVQPLPQRLWPACASVVVPVRLGSPRRGAANAEWEVLPVDGDEAEAVAEDIEAVRNSVPVPVLELAPRWIRPWANLVAGVGSTPARFMVLPARPFASKATAVAGGDGGDTVSAVDELPDAETLLARFRDFASVEALELVEALAAAPLTLSVMRLVQQTLVPHARSSALAEVFLGGLLQERGRTLTSGAPKFGSPKTARFTAEEEYDFLPGVRDRLLEGSSWHVQLSVLDQVAQFLAQRLGSPNDFRAFLVGEESSVEILSASRPFARIALSVLARFGGRYREAVRRLSRLPQFQGLLGNLLEGEGYLHMPDPPTRGIVPSVETRSDDAEGGPMTAVSTATSVQPGGREKSPGVLSTPRGYVPAERRLFGAVPFRNPHFTGREQLLERLHSMLRAGASQMAILPHALHGMGGVGKTQLAIEYCWRYAAEYDLVWWVRAESPTSMRSGLADLAEAMDLPGADINKKVLNVIDVLQQRDRFFRWLLIFDNANTPEEVRPYLPPFGDVLVTSRNSDWAQVAEQLEVDVFTRDESITLLQRRGSGISYTDADRVAEQLGDLPLALDQAGAWQAATAAPAAELLRLLTERMNQWLAEAPAAGPPASLLATWDLAFSELRQRAPGAARLLELLAFFGPDPIAIRLLQEGNTAEVSEPLARVLRDEIQLRRAIREIGRYALAKPNSARDEIEIHRLVQSVLRDQLTLQEQEVTRDAVHRVIGAANPASPDFKHSWDRHAELMPHISPSRVVFGWSEAGHRAALDQIRYRFMRGDYERSASLGETAVTKWRTSRGPNDELTLIAQRHWAVAIRELGKYKEAAALNRETLERLRAVFGDDHEHTIATVNSVGKDLRLQGRWQEARALEEENLERSRRVFGSDEPETARAMNNLAVDLRILGDASGALALDKQCLELRQQLLGVEHPDTLITLVNVIRDNADAGRYSEAHTLYLEAKPRFDALGARHRVAIEATLVLAMILRRSGAVMRAREVAEEQFKVAQRALPAEHEQMLSIALTYANALLAVGQQGQAKKVAEEAWQGYARGFGSDNSLTYAAAVDLAVVLRATREYNRARELDVASWTAFESALGRDHPYTLVAMTNLAHDYALSSDFVAAGELSGTAYERSVQVRGENHPETLICGLNHALDLRELGENEQARELFERVHLTLRRDFGEEHPAARAAAEDRRVEMDIEHWAI